VDDPVGTSSRPQLGIVTVLYQSDGVIDDFFASLALQTDVAFKLYVIDNSPSRGALDRCKELASRYGMQGEFVFNNANVGVAKGNNQGIALALRDCCPFVLLANNDTEFPAGTLLALLAPMAEGESVTTPKMLYPGPERLIWYVDGRIDTWTMRTPHIGMRQPDRGQFDGVRYAKYAPTCFLLVRSALFEQVGIMDERYFVYYDDTDFVWRLSLEGIRIRVVSKPAVVHKVSTSTGGAKSPFTVYYSNRNRIFFIRKNFRGLRKLVALTYALATRLPASLSLPRPAAQRLWAGVRDGLQLTIGP
jgi:GT2 family glycosyltransferase